jgi:hypothetical protein
LNKSLDSLSLIATNISDTPQGVRPILLRAKKFILPQPLLILGVPFFLSDFESTMADNCGHGILAVTCHSIHMRCEWNSLPATSQPHTYYTCICRNNAYTITNSRQDFLGSSSILALGSLDSVRSVHPSAGAHVLHNAFH